MSATVRRSEVDEALAKYQREMYTGDEWPLLFWMVAVTARLAVIAEQLKRLEATDGAEHPPGGATP